MIDFAEERDHDPSQLERAFAGRYKLVEVVGRGAMSTVYRAWEFGLQRSVAIKVLAPVLEDQLEDRERFRREARIAAKFSHPNIVPVYAFDRHSEVTFLVMPFVDGESLSKQMQRAGRMEPKVVRSILADLAGALHCVHSHGVIHRDLKPSNVLMDAITSRPMLTDFGVATLMTSEHSRSEVPKRFGTPQYMSPEQALGEIECDGRSDLYALGVLGYQMLTGRLPFDGVSPRELAAKHVAVAPPPIATLTRDVPEDLIHAIERCLAKAADARWSDAEELGHALRRSSRSRRGFSAWRPLKWLRRLLRGGPPAVHSSGVWVAPETPTLA